MPAAAVPPAGGREAEARLTLDYLLRRMRSKQDFPALSSSITRVQALSESDSDSLQTLCDEILQDVALTQKLLRVVNTAHYRRAGSDPIRTVSRAVSLIGVAGVRNLALSLVLLDHMHDQVHALQLKEAFLHTVMAGTLASELSVSPNEAEEAFVGTLFRRLGWLLVCFYLPEDAEQMRALMRDASQGLSERQAAEQVLGVRLDELGDAVATQWGLPESLRACMRVPEGPLPAHSLAGSPERLHWLASLAEAATDAMLHTPPAELGQALERLQRAHVRALDLQPLALQDAAGRARKRLSELTQALNLSVPAASPAERLLDTYYVDAPHQGDAAVPAPVGLGSVDVDLAETGFTDLGASDTVTPALDPIAILTSGIQDITNTLVESFRLHSVLHMVLETLLRALDCRRVVFCLRDARTGELQGRIGLGEGAEVLKSAFRVPLTVAAGTPPDLFTAVCLKNADTLIADALVPAVARLLPRWFTTHIDAQTFLLLPLMLKRPGQPDMVIGLIYADKARGGSLQIDDRTLSLLRTLRNQAIMAFKQSA
ncbi:MAG: HDOD domain-containing protein [Proteobacteria bacterium]|uniref:HDOD domain-containing protein n=1 Tax=Aquabacterium sp. TaxID=1872578 RepID=UPI0035C70753|nr:HDOD domain-containing protein [Pseudomonadota bacterium]